MIFKKPKLKKNCTLLKQSSNIYKWVLCLVFTLSCSTKLNLSPSISNLQRLFRTRGIVRRASGGDIWKPFCHTQTSSRPPSTARPKVVARGKSSEFKSATVNLESHVAALNERNSKTNELRRNYLGAFESVLSHAETNPTPESGST